MSTPAEATSLRRRITRIYSISGKLQFAGNALISRWFIDERELVLIQRREEKRARGVVFDPRFEHRAAGDDRGVVVVSILLREN